jgi:leucyl aminopeptidase
MMRIGKSFLFKNSQILRPTLSLFSATSQYTDSTVLEVAISAVQSFDFKGDLLVIPFYKPTTTNKTDSAIAEGLKASIPNLSTDIKKIVSDLLIEQIFKADAATKQVIRLHSSESLSTKYIALVGLGPNPKKEVNDLEVTTAARLGKSVLTIAKETKAETVGVVLPDGTNNAGISQFILGLHDASYSDNRYRKVPENGFPKTKLSSIVLLGSSETVATNIKLTQNLTEKIASGVNFAKDLVGFFLILIFLFFNMIIIKIYYYY